VIKEYAGYLKGLLFLRMMCSHLWDVHSALYRKEIFLNAQLMESTDYLQDHKFPTCHYSGNAEFWATILYQIINSNISQSWLSVGNIWVLYIYTCMNACIYIYIYIYMYVCVCVCVCMYLYNTRNWPLFHFSPFYLSLHKEISTGLKVPYSFLYKNTSTVFTFFTFFTFLPPSVPSPIVLWENWFFEWALKSGPHTW
jgi:hypothetical protein